MKIFLIGYRCTGKTTVGKAVAQRLGVQLYDLDDLISQRQGMSIQEMVSCFGWQHFRAIEREMLLELAQKDENAVISCGGGAVLHDVWDEIKKNAKVIWLTASVKTIVERMAADEKTAQYRPALSSCKTLEEEVKEVLSQRLPLYEKAASFVVSTENSSIDGIVEEVLRVLK